MPQVLWVQGEEWGRSKEEREKANKQALQHLHQQGGQEGLHTLSLKEENDKMVAIKVNKQANNGAKHIWVPKEIISNIKSSKKVWILKGKWEVWWTLGNLETWQSMGAFHGVHDIRSCKLPSVLVNMDPNFPSHVRKLDLISYNFN